MSIENIDSYEIERLKLPVLILELTEVHMNVFNASDINNTDHLKSALLPVVPNEQNTITHSSA